ncbi:peptidase S41 [Flavobacterium jejuense]|uniref:Peptidase S41 n=1 Tax=Flavobacterium jejuense TaxID=1544455 RepID=A0ABX0IQ50_9FLAO|nr:S41 family peptidase [Flavobacterium jejuense]NHN24251.1 peptidase S41 [Flavobacterium jejuense]
MKLQLYAFLFFIHFIFSQNKQENGITIFKINTLIQDYHYQPKLVDDSLSLYVFNSIIEKLDREKNVFLQSEYDLLSKHKYNIDNYILDKKCAFLDEIAIYYKKGLERKLKLIEFLEKENISLTTKDTLFFTKRENNFYKDEEGIKRILKKLITYETLKDIALISKNKDSLKMHFIELSNKAKIKTFDTYKCKILNLLKDEKAFEEEIKNTFFKSFCNYFDPHTDYFSYDDKSSFLSNVSSNNSSLGLLFDANENDEIFVNEIIPGSSAFENDKIETGDQVLKIKYREDEFSVSCSSIEQISNYIASDNYKELEITFRKKNGEIFSALIEKKIMKAIENSAYSYVLNQENNFGYIKIPSFYSTEFSINTLSNDVAKEIIKLKEDKVKGLIIDLQYNGGGNVDEAIKLAGMFIDAGPIAVAIDNEKNQTILKDYNRGAIFNEPIVVLVNGMSASASELFANALQDYKRAIIIGNPTYGKATMQSIIPVEDSNLNKDFINLTIQKFYRITGKSHQATGIIPDIELPYLFEHIVPKESRYKTVLNNDEIITNTRYKVYNNDFSEIIASSKTRINTNSYFKKILAINKDIDSFVNNKEDRVVVLTFDGVFKEINETSFIFDKVNELTKEKFDFSVEKNTYDIENTTVNDYSEKYLQKQKEEIQSSAVVFEALEILNNLIK